MSSDRFLKNGPPDRRSGFSGLKKLRLFPEAQGVEKYKYNIVCKWSVVAHIKTSESSDVKAFTLSFSPESAESSRIRAGEWVDHHDK